MNQYQGSAYERRVLTPEAVAFLTDLENKFGWRRGHLLEARELRQQDIDQGVNPEFLDETRHIRDGDWKIGPVPAELQDRRVEITGPVDAKMMINALNSGARVFMADFEDATAPTWENLLTGQANLVDAYDRTLEHQSGDKVYRLDDEIATLVIRPRGWHLEEKHFLVDGRPMSASLFDFGLYLFHGGRAAIRNGSGPYVYLPKLESHLEARLWNDVFLWSQERLGIPRGTVKATVLIETILAAFEMDEILYELGEHAAGLNAGRWDYIFSIIKKFRNRSELVLPDRSRVTMKVPFMQAYTGLMVQTCHRRGAHAIGGMSAFIPNRRDPEVTERAVAAVAADKAREADAGFDGTWVAHPDLVPVALQEFDRVLGDGPNQLSKQIEAPVTGIDLLNFEVPGEVTTEGVRANVSVGIRYLASWLAGTGAVAIDNLMEDVATAEISRSQIWQWIQRGVVTSEGVPVDDSLVRSLADVEVANAGDYVSSDHLHTARKIFEEVSLSETFIEFLTLPAYELIN